MRKKGWMKGKNNNFCLHIDKDGDFDSFIIKHIQHIHTLTKLELDLSFFYITRKLFCVFLCYQQIIVAA